MVHPAVFAAIVAGAFISLKLYEEYLENSYEQFQRNRTRYEQEYNRFHCGNNDFDFDDDRDYGFDKEEAEDKEHAPYTLRQRRPHGASSEDIPKSICKDSEDEYELSELENSVAERRRRLMAEQAFLDQEEENLRNRKNEMMRNYDDVTNNLSDSNMFSAVSHNSSSDGYQHSLEDHMARFDPFAGQFKETADGTDDNYSKSNSDSVETVVIDPVITSSPSNVADSTTEGNTISNSMELRYPSPRTTTPSTSSNNSVSEEGRSFDSSNLRLLSSARGSDSEESWDAVSDNDWNQSSAYESDHGIHSHHSITSFSEDEDDDALHHGF